MAKDKTRTILIAGGAGFVGSHLCEFLLNRGDRIICVDNLCTGRKKNVSKLLNNPNFVFVEHDITQELPKNITQEKYDAIANLASPASPPRYVELALETLLVGALGTKNLLDLALSSGARFVQASTSEVYGDPTITPQIESYWGNVNSYGARSMYDESKRFAEALIWVYKNQKKVNTGIVRIFNTYGPHMDPEDGRVISNFVVQALRNDPITIYGDGHQTRSFCYVDDQVSGLVAMIDSSEEGPVNVGNPDEFTIAELAQKVIKLTKSQSTLVNNSLPPDDPMQRRPDITRAKTHLGWQPKISLEVGLLPTIAYFKKELQQKS